MRIGIIGPSKVKNKREIIKELAKLVAESGHEIVVTPDKGSSSELFAQEYSKAGGKKVFEVLPLDDNEFANWRDWINVDLGEHINCGTWRNAPEKLNEETDVLLCIGYSVGFLIEIGYTKWFKPKPVYIVKELVRGKLPEEIKGLDLRYISVDELKNELK